MEKTMLTLAGGAILTLALLAVNVLAPFGLVDMMLLNAIH